MSAGERLDALAAADVIRRVRGTADWIPSLDDTARVPVDQLGTSEESLISSAELVLNKNREWVHRPPITIVVDELWAEVIA